ncbi:MAG: hypothetical protein IJG84_11845 [Kiritimatiellae bacterium]|nr:hypothetical protein [Kiritimatiellia bacterium]
MAVVMKQFIDKFKAMEKVANETLAADPEALAGVDSMPGSEHDAKVPAEAKKPNPEVAQGQPAGATSAEGAVNGGDAKPLNEGKLEMDQPLENPEKKPLITDDALTAKVANAQLVGLVKDLLADLKTEKQAQCGGGAAPAAKPAPAAAPANKEEKKDDGNDGKGGEKKASPENVIKLDDETIAKLAAAQVAFANGRAAAEKVIKQASGKKEEALTPEAARALIKAACIKEAQEQGMDPAAAEAAVDNAMLTAGVAPEAAAADAGAAAADAGAAEAAAADAGADAGAAEMPDDVTEEELATAIVDLVSSGELDPDTAKALVEEIAGDEGAAGPTEDQAAEIIAQGLESGEITPEQAQQIAAAVEGGAADSSAAAADAGAAAADAGAADAEAQGAADAEAAIKDAQDEAQGAADAEAAMKAASEQIRQNTIQKVAAKIIEKRAAAQAPAPGSKVMAKVASILQAKVAEKKAAAAKPADESETKYIEGFRKKAEEMGVDPSLLAKYVVERQSQAQAK